MRTSTSATEDFHRKENPRYKANFLSYITFWYTLQVFRRGYKGDVTEYDLTKPLPSHASKKLTDITTKLWLEEVERAKKKNTHPSLKRVFCKQFGKEFFLMALILCVMEFGIRIFQPMFVGLLIRYFLEHKDLDMTVKDNVTDAVDVRYLMRVWYYWTPQKIPISKGEAYLYATGIIFCSGVAIAVIHPYMLSVQHIGMKMKVASCALMYRKAMQLDLTAVGGGTTGFVVNLMSNDVNRFDMVPLFLHYVWISPLQFLVILYFIYREVGVSSFAGTLSIIIVLPLQVYLGWEVARLRKKIAVKTDTRVRQMNEIITGIPVIKMYAWEYAFADLIDKSRKDEIRLLSKTVYIRGAIMSFVMFTTRSAIFFTILTHVMTGNNITSESVFVITSYYQIVRQTMSVYLPQALSYLAEAIIAIKRIEEFLQTKETGIINPTPFHPDVQMPPDDPSSKNQPSKDQSFKDKHSKDPFNIDKSSKDSLLKNLHPKDTTPSEPPLVKITNVTCKYGEALCLQNISFEVKPGQLTVLIGPVASGKSCAMNLVLGELLPISGSIIARGTKSYACQETWLFEGSVRQNILFGQTYQRERYKEVIKVCSLLRDFQLFPYGDRTIVGERGVSLSGGQRARINLARCIYKNADIYLLDDPLSAVDTQVGKALFDKCIVGYLKNKIVILATHQLQYLKPAYQIIVLEDGFINAKGTFDSLKQSKQGYAKLLGETFMSDQVEGEEEATLVKWSRPLKKESYDASIQSYQSVKSSMAPKVQLEMRTVGEVTCSIYKKYFNAGGNCCATVCVLLFFILTQILASITDIGISEWVVYEEHSQGGNSTTWLTKHLSSENCINIYSGLMVLLIIMSLGRSFLFFHYCMNASIKLHNSMFESICSAPLKFFNANSSGRILNRFSKDLGAIDEFLPVAMIDTFQITLNLFGAIIVLAIVNQYLMIPAAVVIIVFYLLRRVYIKTSTSIKRIEGVTKSPVFSHFNATMNGLTTIRSHGRENTLSNEFDEYQDLNSSAFYLFMCTSRAFGYWLDILCVIFIAMVTYLFLLLPRSSVEGAHVGLCITLCIGLTSLFQWGMRQSAEMENQMTSVERVLEFTNLEREANKESSPDHKPPPDWPTQGAIEFRNTVLRYSQKGEPVLKSLQLQVAPKEKYIFAQIGIVGRTGAGKSSLMNCLFRLSEFEGKIYIDTIDISMIGLHDLRKNISIIPQEPLIFSGTLRYNVDPFNKYTDEKILDTLLTVEIKFAKIHGSACLGIMLTDGGANLSMGQRQLVCLARAILYNNKILVMDEATANMDPQTDRFIQVTILNKFSDCTVLTIAHRLNTVMHSDRVLVMDAGKIVEIDHPHILLQKPDGVFSKMVEKTGPDMQESLRKRARESYLNKYGRVVSTQNKK